MFKEKFNCQTLSENFQFSSNGNSFEIDLLALSDEIAYIIEIKSHYRDGVIEQVEKQISKFKKIKLYQNLKVCAVIVATHYDKLQIKEVINSGIYFISIADDLVKLKTNKYFKPTIW